MGNPADSSFRASMPLFSPELVESQGRADREYLTARVNLLLEVKDKHPGASFTDIAQLANDPCGRGCCCCCNTLVLGSDVINPGP